MELLDIFDEDMVKIGTSERKEVHRQGFWHQTFHCWFVKKINNELYVYVQKRQKGKDTFPEKFDVTAAGHLLSTETPEDGIREVKEELGIDVDLTKLVPMGIVANEIVTETYTDREFCHIYLYLSDNNFVDFMLQTEEVSGMYLIKLADLEDVICRRKNELAATGYEINDNHANSLTTVLTVNDFVPHQQSYFEAVFSKMHEINQSSQ